MIGGRWRSSGLICLLCLSLIPVGPVLGTFPFKRAFSRTRKQEVFSDLDQAPILESSGDQFDFRRAIIAQQAKSFAAEDGTVLWTLANFSWLEFVLNWVAMVRRAGIEHFFVATLDDELASHLKRMEIPCLTLHSQIGGNELDWGSDAFKERGLQKIRFIVSMLELDIQPMFSDLDVIWLKNPLPFVAEIQEPNILVSSDSCQIQQNSHLDNCSEIMGTNKHVEGEGNFVGVMNVGIHVLRPSALQFAKVLISLNGKVENFGVLAQAWLQEMQASGDMEQLAWNKIFMRYLVLPSESNISDSYCRSMSGSVVAGILPASLFMNGHTYFAQHLTMNLNLDPLAVHASWIGGSEQKLFHFREDSLWLVDKNERFNAPSTKFLTLDLDIPKEMLSNSGPPENLDDDLELKDAAGHLSLMRHQFLQVRAAAQMAQILNRTLIMPKLYCGVENLWQSHKGRFWGGSNNYTLPFQCSMTQIFEVHKWTTLARDEGILPYFVESSFIDNPKLKLTPKDTFVLDSCSKSAGIKCCEVEKNGSQPKCQAKLHDIRFSGPFENLDLIPHMLQDIEGYKLVTMKNVLDYWPVAIQGKLSKFDLAYNEVRREWCCVRDNKRVAIEIAQRMHHHA